jgi:hypothetical protein
MFTVKGMHRGEKFDLTWDAGKLSGTHWAMVMFDVELPHAFVKPPGGPAWKGKQCKKSASPAWLFMKKIFDEVEFVSGELPPLPSIPDGATP